MTTNIPMARELLKQAAKNTTDKATKAIIDIALSMMTRERKKRIVAQVKSRRMTPDLKAEIAAYYIQHPEKSTKEIGNTFNVNQGRVSEVIEEFGL